MFFGVELSLVWRRGSKSTRTGMELPELPRVPFPMRVRRQVQPVQRADQDLHNPETSYCKGTMLQLQDPQPSIRPILQELRNKTLTTPLVEQFSLNAQTPIFRGGDTYSFVQTRIVRSPNPNCALSPISHHLYSFLYTQPETVDWKVLIPVILVA